MNETKADKILDLIETAVTTLSEDIRKVTEKVIEIDAKVDRNANLIQDLQRGLDDTRLMDIPMHLTPLFRFHLTPSFRSFDPCKC